jgi:hypothetical protein
MINSEHNPASPQFDEGGFPWIDQYRLAIRSYLWMIIWVLEDLIYIQF